MAVRRCPATRSRWCGSTPSLRVPGSTSTGTTRGDHRNDDVNAVMNGTIGATRLRVGTPPNARPSRLSSDRDRQAQAGPPQPGASGTSAPMDVRDFVRQVFIHECLTRRPAVTTSAVPVLLAMLRMIERGEVLGRHVAVLLGLIGDERAVEPMISLIQSDPGPAAMSPARYRAKTSALMAMGYVINRTVTKRALNYLQESPGPRPGRRGTSKVLPPSRPARASGTSTQQARDHGPCAFRASEAAQTLRSLQHRQRRTR